MAQRTFQAQRSASSGEAERHGGHGRLQRRLPLWNLMILQGFGETEDICQPAYEVECWLQLRTSLQCPCPAAFSAPVQNATRCYQCNWRDPNHIQNQAQRRWYNWKPASGVSVSHCGVHTSPAKSCSRKRGGREHVEEGLVMLVLPESTFLQPPTGNGGSGGDGSPVGTSWCHGPAFPL